MRQNSLNIQDYLNDEVMDDLALTLDGVIENIQTSAVSEALKSKNGSGEPSSGTVEYKRFVNAQLEDKGTARGKGEGKKVIAKPVFINIDDNKEIIEELQEKDIKLYGINGMAEKRKANFTKRVIAYLDRKFFATMVNAGEKFERGTLTNLKDVLDAMIVKIKATESEFIDGIDVEDLAIVLSTSARKEFKNYLDELPNGTSPSNGLIGMYDSIETYETHRLPEGVNMIITLKESVALPYYLSDYNAEKIPFDDAIALETFLYNGAGALVDEAILYDGTVAVGGASVGITLPSVYDVLTVAQIKVLLDELSIDYDGVTKKADLIALIPEGTPLPE